ncbi:MAG: LysM peptidoglycan-binding domain-containing protein [Anaerolineales bacterium]|nr:LysM peptidoglycan-binding domain-containing protein [Anaerolineales bacterium]
MKILCFAASILSVMLACSRAGIPALTELQTTDRLASPTPTTAIPSQDLTDSNSEENDSAQDMDTTSVIIDYVPTPDPDRGSPTIRTEAVSHIVSYGETLQSIARDYAVGMVHIQEANGIANPNLLYQGQVLTIPPQSPEPAGSAYKLIPDSELVYSPASIGFDPENLVNQFNGYLSICSEEADDQIRSGVEIVERVSWLYSVNPRLLLALLEYQSGWVFSSSPEDTGLYPMGYLEPGYEGLYSQLSWTADQLNYGYYLWRAGWKGPYLFSSGETVYIARGLNAGTVAVQYLFSQLYEPGSWRQVISEDGFYHTYFSMFGSPYAWQMEPLIPENLSQPDMQLPFEPGRGWYFTGGPHSAWGNYAAWGALDFAPPGEGLGCIPSYDWVTAAADGVIVRADTGAIVQDLDGDGDERTGWVLLYMHIASFDRVSVGTELSAGDRIGHPSCEGGISTGTHVHLARKYNGEWITADGDLPFNLDGWISSGAGIPYDGWLTRDGQAIEAYWTDSPENMIYR